MATPNRKARNYAAKYRLRNERAQAQGYRGYNRKRKASERIKETIEQGGSVKDELDDLLNDLFDDEETGTSLIWQLFRNQYGKGSTAA